MKRIVRYAVLFTFLAFTSSFITPVWAQQLVLYYDLEGDNDAYEDLKETVADIKGMSEEELQENGIVTAFIKKTGNLHVLTITLSDSSKKIIHPYSLRVFLQKVSIPECIETISESAFEGCKKLTSIKIPNSVTSIGEMAFMESGLTSIEIPDSVTSIGESAFEECENLTSIKIPNSVTSIGRAAFRDSGLTSIEIPDSVTSIGEMVFHRCKKLTSIKIPNSVTSIGEMAFMESGLTSIEIPDSVTSIGEGAFQFCENLTSIKIPNSVTSIGWEAFSDCNSLTSLMIPISVTTIDGAVVNSEFTAIKLPEEKSCFQIDGCLLLSKNGETLVSLIKPTKDVVIPGTVKIIGKNAFRRSNLTSVFIPNSVTKIEDNAFCDCQDLTSLEIPNSVTSIGRAAFLRSGLTSVVIPNSVKEIGSSAFANTHQITIPNSLVIGDGAVPWEAFPYDVEIIKR